MGEINLFSNKQHFHRYSTDDFALLGIGVGNYNFSSLEKFFDRKDPDVREFFSFQDISTKDKLLGIGRESSMEIEAYIKETNSYEKIKTFREIVKLDPKECSSQDFQQPPSTLKQFLEEWDKIQKGIIIDERKINGYKSIIQRIENSSSGCITFDCDYTVLNQSRTSFIQLFLIAGRDERSDRIVAMADAPVISVLPQTAEGLTYSKEKTRNAPPGSYVRASREDNNSLDKTAGRLRLVQDPITGELESGTQQIIARLIDKLPAGNVKQMRGEQVEAADNASSYKSGKESKFHTSPTSAKAVPLSAENGNPNLLGPNFIGGCENDVEKSTITVFNHTNISYPDGAQVICSKIDGNWIVISGIGGEESDQKNLINVYSFGYQKFFVDGLTYFQVPQDKNNIFDTSKLSNYPRKKINNILEQEILSRQLFYTELANKRLDYEENPLINDTKTMNNIIKLNLVVNSSTTLADANNIYVDIAIDRRTVNVNEIKQEAIKEIADDKKLCVSHTVKDPDQSPFLFRNPTKYWELPKNVLDPKALEYPGPLYGNADIVTADQMAGWWGVLFPDGYKGGVFVYTPESTDIFYDPNFHKHLALEGTFGNIPNFDTFAESAAYARYILASDIDLEDIQSLIKDSSVGYQLKIENLDSNYILPKEEQGSPAKFVPINPLKVQLSSCSFDTMVNITCAAGFSDQGILGRTSEQLKNYKLFDAKTTPKHDTLRYLSLRPRLHGSESSSNGSILIQANNHYGWFLPPYIPVQMMKYHIETSSSSISFECDQSLGLPQKSTVSPGFGPEVTILPIGIGIGWSSPGVPPSTRVEPQWGGDGDLISSLGTTALYTRVFEYWNPLKTTIFPSFAIKHYSSPPTEQQQKINKVLKELERDGEDEEENKISDCLSGGEALSELDLPVPTRKGGSTVLSPGNIIQTQEDKDSSALAPVSEWQISKVRKNKLLSHGGFYYPKYILAVKDVRLKTVDGDRGGRGYEEGETFVFKDGSKIEITSVIESGDDAGKILNIEFTSKVIDRNIIRFDENSPEVEGYTTDVNIRPVYSGGSGSGAEFDVTLVCAIVLEHDPGPKELTNGPTRLTSSNRNGVSRVEGKTSRTIGLSNARQYDVYYFYYNDPNHYLSDNGPWSRNNAEYVVVEMK